MKFAFGDIVVVGGNLIGVVVKCWGKGTASQQRSYEVYVRMTGEITEYQESEIERYMVRHKYLDDEEMRYQANCLRDD